MEIMRANREWASRPADERFTSLSDLHAHVTAQRLRSKATVVSSRRLECVPTTVTDIEIHGPNGTGYAPTHWSFGQLAGLAGAPAGYLRSLPAPVVADCLNYGFRFGRDIEDVGVMLRKGDSGHPEDTRIAAATGPKYGRVWNADITGALLARFGDGVSGNWTVPGTFGNALSEVTKANTTLYASDRDLFVFLADEKNRIEVPDRRNGQSGSLARGFFAWNSEVGAQSLGGAFFLFDYVCSNRIVWGAQQYNEIRLRHTASAPDRWLSEVEPVLIEYANSQAKPVQEAIAAAKARKIDDIEEWLAKRYTVKAAANYAGAFGRDEGRPMETLWDAVTGMTAYARGVEYQDARVTIEREAGKVLAMAA